MVPVANCSFEMKKNGAYCGLWHDLTVGDEFNWSSRSGKTSSSYTGPLGAADGEKYLYIEASSPRNKGDAAILQTWPLDFTADLAMRFKYHMYGQDVASLTVLVDGAELWSQSGNQGNSWKDGLVDISEFQLMQPIIAFEATRGKSYRGDIAIDNVEFVVPPKPTPPPTPKP